MNGLIIKKKKNLIKEYGLIVAIIYNPTHSHADFLYRNVQIRLWKFRLHLIVLPFLVFYTAEISKNSYCFT